MSVESRRRIGEGFALILYFILDAYEGWPLSHSVALLAAVIGASSVLFAELPLRPWVGSTVISSVAAIFVYLIVGPVLPKETPIHGWLEPANDPTPASPCMPSPKNQGNWLFVAFGPGGVLSAADTTFTVLKIGDYDAIKMTREDNRVEVNVEIKDAEGT